MCFRYWKYYLPLLLNKLSYWWGQMFCAFPFSNCSLDVTSISITLGLYDLTDVPPLKTFENFRSIVQHGNSIVIKAVFTRYGFRYLGSRCRSSSLHVRLKHLNDDFADFAKYVQDLNKQITWPHMCMAPIDVQDLKANAPRLTLFYFKITFSNFTNFPCPQKTQTSTPMTQN